MQELSVTASHAVHAGRAGFTACISTGAMEAGDIIQCDYRTGSITCILLYLVAPYVAGRCAAGSC